MQYGYFDDALREYVITRPDTPAPWANYLGSPEYGALISNNAGGYSFVKSGANGRILRYVFNQFDQPGRYIYLRDNGSGEVWSASWQPVGRSLDEYKNECRHGTGYTKMLADFRGIHSEAVYYVPLDGTHEVWQLTVRNDSKERRELTLTGYAEFTNNGNYEQDQVNLQYSQFITRTLYDAGRIRQQLHGNLDAISEDDEVDSKNVTERFFALAGAEASSYCGDKDQFLGPYRQYGSPIGVERGDLGGALNYNGNGCGALSTVAALEPGETKTIAFLLGEKHERESAALLKDYRDVEAVCAREVEELTCFWHGKLSHFQVKTPCPEFDSMINTWNAYNSFITFTWSRAASFIYCGLRNGYGYPEVEKLSNDKSITYLKDGTEVHWIINPNQDGVYQQKLDEALAKQAGAAADDKIDMFLVEADYALKYIDPDVDVALPISQLGITSSDIANQYKYTQEAVTTADGEIRALSYQATPGMLVYRRSIAKDVLGTDDPEVVGAAVANWDKFYETAEQMKAAGYYMYSGRTDTYRMYANNVSAPWVDGNTVVVDQNMMNWVENSMRDTENGIHHKVGGQWIDEWNKDMGPDGKVFAFFLPAWGLDVCIAPNVANTTAAEDWAVCPPPQGFYWGGTWLIACNGTDNAEQVKDIMLKMTADTDILRRLAEDYGEMSNDQPLMEELASSPDFGIPLLSGQNYIGVLSDGAASISLSNVSPYDQGCTEEFLNTFGDYFNGTIDLDTAKANFEVAIGERYPELKAGGVKWP